MILWLAACGGPDGIEVFAASSLEPAFQELASVYEAEHPDVDVRIATAGSQTLSLQIAQGARADLFAAAHRSHIESLDRAGAPVVFAHNDVVMATAADHPLPGPEALAGVSRVVRADGAVPIGSYTDQLLAQEAQRHGAAWREQVDTRVVSLEFSVRQVRARLVRGDADAGYIYRSDLEPGLVEVPGAHTLRTELTVAPIDHSTRGQQWIEWLHSPQARAVLVAHGFAP